MTRTRNKPGTPSYSMDNASRGSPAIKVTIPRPLLARLDAEVARRANPKAKVTRAGVVCEAIERSLDAIDMAPYIARLRREFDPQHQRGTRDRIETVLRERGITTIRELEILMLALGLSENSNAWGRVMGLESEG